MNIVQATVFTPQEAPTQMETIPDESALALDEVAASMPATPAVPGSPCTSSGQPKHNTVLP